MIVQSSRRRQGGLTLVETLIAVVVGLIIIAGGFVMFGMVISGNKLGDAEQDLATTQLNVKQLYQGQPNYTGLSNANAIAANVFTTDMVAGAAVVDQWDGAVTLAAGVNPTQFTIEYDGVPQDACIKLSSFEFGQWVAYTINGTAISEVTGGAGPVAAAVAACTAGATNALIWTTT